MEIRLIDNISASNSCNYTDKCTIVSGQVKKNPENADRRQRLLHYSYRRSFVTTWDQTQLGRLDSGHQGGVIPWVEGVYTGSDVFDKLDVVLSFYVRAMQMTFQLGLQCV